MPRHIKCVCGKPCSNNRGGPDPEARTKILVLPVWICADVNFCKTPDNACRTARVPRATFSHKGRREENCTHPSAGQNALRGGSAIYLFVSSIGTIFSGWAWGSTGSYSFESHAAAPSSRRTCVSPSGYRLTNKSVRFLVTSQSDLGSPVLFAKIFWFPHPPNHL